MSKDWTFGRRIIAAFSVVVATTVAVGVVSMIALTSVVSNKDHVINVTSPLLINAQELAADHNAESGALRAYLLTGKTTYLTQWKQDRQAFTTLLASTEKLAGSATERRLIAAIGQAEKSSLSKSNALLALRTNHESLETISRKYSAAASAGAKGISLSTTVAAFVAAEQRLLQAAVRSSSNTASDAETIIVVLIVLFALISSALAFVLARSLRRQLGTAVGELNSSSTELEATANQQVAGAKEQANAMNEVSMTINQLLATSRQIAASAQSVATIADRTANAGKAGDETVTTAQESIEDIRHQVDVIVSHMLDLGEKSQRIGSVLDIVTELAEQTNILAINSTIEAAGAGEAGARFGIVADEIRKLGDRVAESTREVRSLIDEVRSAVNRTVMATELGSKAVDSGSGQLGVVAASFSEIVGMVATITDAAREIELSTQQQATAVEQVNVAISNVAQSTKETEASSSQTYQTATQLTVLSESLARLVEPQLVG